jgi:hypothetical protein
VISLTVLHISRADHLIVYPSGLVLKQFSLFSFCDTLIIDPVAVIEIGCIQPHLSIDLESGRGVSALQQLGDCLPMIREPDSSVN